MSDYPSKLVTEGLEVLRSRIPSGHPIIHDGVNTVLFHKWVLNCIGFLGNDLPEHVAQIKRVHKPDIALYHQAEQIYAVVISAVEILKARTEKLSKASMAERSPKAFALDFLNSRLVEKCSDHFYAAKYDDCILNSAKTVEVLVRETAQLPDEEIGVNLMRKAFRPGNAILKLSDVAAEQEAAMNLFCGFIGFFKNPHSHKFLNISDLLSAFEVLSIANHLCTLVGKAQKA
jgi:uncharacterized protein (TIGR02391 family)